MRLIDEIPMQFGTFVADERVPLGEVWIYNNAPEVGVPDGGTLLREPDRKIVNINVTPPPAV